MKWKSAISITIEWLSRPARGAWVEILGAERELLWLCGRAPQGARGLKS